MRYASSTQRGGMAFSSSVHFGPKDRQPLISVEKFEIGPGKVEFLALAWHRAYTRRISERHQAEPDIGSRVRNSGQTPHLIKNPSSATYCRYPKNLKCRLTWPIAELNWNLLSRNFSVRARQFVVAAHWWRLSTHDVDRAVPQSRRIRRS